MRIVITGVSRGLGRVMAEGFIAEGHHVLGCARSQDSIRELQELYGKPHHFSTVDIADDSQVKAWSYRLLSEYGPPDLLVNNAGLINPLAPLWEVPAEEFDAVIDVNIKGVANVIRHFVPDMVERQRGIIVNFSSGWGRSTSPQVAPYCATKWAIEGLTRALAQELPAGMAAIPLNPGIIHTDMLEQCYGESAANYTKLEDWAKQAVEFLLQIQPNQNGEPLTVPA
jgi:NAD(P)-dependent dehydrogenase (short-subunit alcohol dehydrogenase family)